MKSKLKITSTLIYSLISLIVVSCGSTKDGVSAVDYDGIYDDLSYYSPKEESKEAEQKVVEPSQNPFLLGYDQVMEYDPTEFLFTDIESYSTPYDEDLVSVDSLNIGYSAETPWAYNNNKVEVNVYNNEFLPPAYFNPYFGWGGMNFYIGGFGYPPLLYGWNTYPYWNHGWGRYPYYYRPYPGYRPGRYPYHYGKRDSRMSYQGRYSNRTYASNSPRSRAARVNAGSRTRGYKSYSKNGRTRSYSRDGRTTYSKTRNQTARGNSSSGTRRSSNKSYQSRNRSSNRSYNNSSSRSYGNRSSSSSMRRSSGYSRGGGSSSRGSSSGRRSGGRGNQ